MPRKQEKKSYQVKTGIFLEKFSSAAEFLPCFLIWWIVSTSKGGCFWEKYLPLDAMETSMMLDLNFWDSHGLATFFFKFENNPEKHRGSYIFKLAYCYPWFGGSLGCLLFDVFREQWTKLWKNLSLPVPGGLVNGTRNSGFSQIAPRQLYVRYFDQLTGKGTKEKWCFRNQFSLVCKEGGQNL